MNSLRGTQWLMAGILIGVLILATGTWLFGEHGAPAKASAPADIAAVAYTPQQVAAITGAELLLCSGNPSVGYMPLIGK